MKYDIITVINQYGLITVHDFHKIYTSEDIERAYVIFTIPAEIFDIACIKIKSETVFVCAGIINVLKIRIANIGQNQCTECKYQSFIK